MSHAPISYFHRARRRLEDENIPGEAWLRWLYSGSLTGRAALHLLVKRAFLSRWYGRRMDHPKSRHRVIAFIAEHEIDVEEFAKSPWSYRSFNDFFYRKLKDAARPIHPDADSAILPADGRHLVFQNVEQADGFYVKGDRFTLAELFGGESLARRFAGGAMLISRLAPVDYHRFHFPAAGQAGAASEIPGPLFSVNPIALQKNVRYLVQNKRMLSVLDTPRFGPVAMIEVGATMVGGIRQTYTSHATVKKGEEKGLFKFGGSCVITVFQANRIRFDEDLREQSVRGVETYAKMGERLGVATGSA